MRRTRLSCAFVLLLTLSLSVSMTSCGSGGGNSDSDLVLLGFSFPDVSGIALNEPLVFTFSTNVLAESITLDTLRVVGAVGPRFEQPTTVDGNLVALIPVSPNFENYSDAGLAPGTVYSVSMPTFPAVDTIETPDGKPLLEAESFTFTTLPFPSFVEPSRSILNGVSPSAGGRSDNEGCLQNSQNALYVPPNVDPSVVQTGSGPGARLLCLRNEGAPHIINDESFPTHDQRAVGDPSAVSPGLIEMDAIRLKINEPLDPVSVAPYEPTTQTPLNVQLWRVAFRDGSPVSPSPERVATNKPVVKQTETDVEILLVPAGPIQQGIYCINVTPSVRDLPGNALVISDRPNSAIGGYNVYETSAFNAVVPGGYRIFFRTLIVPNTALSIIEDFNTNLAEHGDLDSGTSEPGMFTGSVVDVGTPGVRDGNPLFDFGGATPNIPLVYTASDPVSAGIGQSTTADWNQGNGSGYRFLNLDSMPVNPAVATAARVRANFMPHRGNGFDGSFNSPNSGASFTLDATNASQNGDGVFEYTSFSLAANDTIQAVGNKALLIVVQGNATINGTIQLNGVAGSPGLDTDGSRFYEPINGEGAPVESGGIGGSRVAGGGVGGNGGSWTRQNNGNGFDGTFGANLFGTYTLEMGASRPGLRSQGVADTDGLNNGSGGGGGGGNVTDGETGSRADGTDAGNASASNAGLSVGDALFTREISNFEPDRGYAPFSNIAGGSGGGGGSLDDDDAANEVGNATVENGDDGGAGGGSGGGGICIICSGTLTVGATASIQANGGRGGNTYAFSEQVRAPGFDGTPNNADDVITGAINASAPGTGSGGPGGGGAGGNILLIGGTSLTVDAGATISAVGGSGGTSGDVDRVGGAGSDGRISLITFAGATLPVNNSVSVSPTPFLSTSSADQYNAPITTGSVAQSEWIDLFTPTSVFDPDPDGAGPTPIQTPTFSSNFQDLIDEGLIMGVGQDFDAVLEFQGADDLNPAVGSGSTPTSADGLTIWEDVANVANLNGKRFFRWRFRFFVDAAYPVATEELPAIINLEIPFEK